MNIEFLQNKFKNAEFINLEGGYNHKTILIKGTEPLVVAKIFEKNSIEAKTENNVLTHLNNLSISPKIYDNFEDNSNIYIIMEYIQGINGQKYLDNGDINRSKEIYKQLGFILSKKIHSIKHIGGHSNIPFIELGNYNLNNLEFLTKEIKQKIKHILKIKTEDEITLVHGDFGSHNTILSDDFMRIIDWEWAGWGKPELDIAWIIWFLHLHYPNYCNELSKIFIDEYLSHKNIEINKNVIKKYSLYKVINILLKAIELDEKIKTEWIRRLEWTLDYDFNIFI